MANTNVGIVITAKDLTAGAFNSVRSSLAKVESVLFSVKPPHLCTVLKSYILCF